jgi:hypothetical protein
MTGRQILAAVALALAVILGMHLLVMLAVAVVAVTLAALVLGIACQVSESGWRTVPCRRRFSW